MADEAGGRPGIRMKPHGLRDDRGRKLRVPVFTLSVTVIGALYYATLLVPLVNILLSLLSPIVGGLLLPLLIGAIAFDTWRGAMPRAVGLAVFGLLGLYWTACAVERLELARHEAQLRKENASAVRSLNYDPTRHAIRVEKQMGLDAESLVRAFHLPVAYETDFAPGTSTRQSFAHRLLPTSCRTLNDLGATTLQTTSVRRNGAGGVEKAKGFFNDLCLVRSPEEPRGRIISIGSSNPPEDGFASITVRTITFEEDGQVVASYRSATATPRPWLPVPVVFCHRECNVRFPRRAVMLDTRPTALRPILRERRFIAKDVAGHVLGLRAYRNGDWHDFDGFGETDLVLESLRAKSVEETADALALLDRILAGERLAPPLSMRRMLGNDPGSLAPRIDAMIERLDALGSAGNVPYRAETESLLSGLLASLPVEALAPRKKQLVRLFSARLDDIYRLAGLYKRMGSLIEGPDDPLVAMYRRDWQRADGIERRFAILALCRMPTLSDKDVRSMKSELTSLGGEGIRGTDIGTRNALVVTLHEAGESAFVDRFIRSAPEHEAREMRRLLSTARKPDARPCSI